MPPVEHLLASDLDHLWHPYASTTQPGTMHLVREARGTRLVLDAGDGPVEVVDAMASWWCQVHGYRNPVLDRAAHAQLDTFSHVMFGGLTHEPAIRLAEQLVAMTPEPLERVFLADSGSVAMEVACKMVRQWQVARGGANASRRRFAALRGAYHGDTWGVMALCDPDGGMHQMYAGAVEQHLFLPRPPAFAAPAEEVDAWAEQARALVHAHRDELAGVVVEPVLQGAGGMWSWSPAALRVLRELADRYELLLVADEIATGLGRTGRLWACEWADVAPDVLVLGKALTGGYCTQAAVVTTQAVARTISEGCGALMHGPTFMANPLACAISSASLGLIEQHWSTQLPVLEAGLHAGLDHLGRHPGVTEVRILGGTAAVELAVPLDMALATRTAVEHGAWLRPFRNLVYAMPPYVCTDDDLATITGAIDGVVEALTQASLRQAPC